MNNTERDVLREAIDSQARRRVAASNRKRGIAHRTATRRQQIKAARDRARYARLYDAIGDDTAVNPDEHVCAVMNMLDARGA